MINKELSKEYFLDVLSEMEAQELHELLGAPEVDTDWDVLADNFFEMRWGLMTDTDKEYYTAEARESVGEDGVYQPV